MRAMNTLNRINNDRAAAASEEDAVETSMANQVAAAPIFSYLRARGPQNVSGGELLEHLMNTHDARAKDADNDNLKAWRPKKGGAGANYGAAAAKGTSAFKQADDYLETVRCVLKGQGLPQEGEWPKIQRTMAQIRARLVLLATSVEEERAKADEEAEVAEICARQMAELAGTALGQYLARSVKRRGNDGDSDGASDSEDGENSEEASEEEESTDEDQEDDA